MAVKSCSARPTTCKLVIRVGWRCLANRSIWSFGITKTDWWGEREVVWTDAAPYRDPDPLDGPLRTILEAEYGGRVTVVNPFGTVVTQNKLSLALMWESIGRFSPLARRWIRRYIPETYRLTQVRIDEVIENREQWVLKSAYGCEGDETVCGPYVRRRSVARYAGPRHPGILDLSTLFFRRAGAKW